MVSANPMALGIAKKTSPTITQGCLLVDDVFFAHPAGENRLFGDAALLFRLGEKALQLVLANRGRPPRF